MVIPRLEGDFRTKTSSCAFTTLRLYFSFVFGLGTGSSITSLDLIYSTCPSLNHFIRHGHDVIASIPSSVAGSSVPSLPSDYR